MQKPGQNLLAKTSRSASSCLNNETVVANFRESELFTPSKVRVVPFMYLLCGFLHTQDIL